MHEKIFATTNANGIVQVPVQVPSSVRHSDKKLFCRILLSSKKLPPCNTDKELVHHIRISSNRLRCHIRTHNSTWPIQSAWELAGTTGGEFHGLVNLVRVVHGPRIPRERLAVDYPGNAVGGHQLKSGSQHDRLSTTSESVHTDVDEAGEADEEVRDEFDHLSEGDDDTDLMLSTRVRLLCINSTAEREKYVKDLKERFLNRLAEIVSTGPPAVRVTACAWKEEHGATSIWIARNEAFSEADRQFLENDFATSLRTFQKAINSGREGSVATAAASMWQVILEIYKTRLKEDCAKQFIHHLNKQQEVPPPSLEQGIELVSARLERLRSLCQADLKNTVQDGKLSYKAYTLREDSEFHERVTNSKGQSHRTEQLWKWMCFLARPRVALDTFKEYLSEVTNSKTFSIHCIPQPTPTTQICQEPLSLADVLTKFSEFIDIPNLFKCKAEDRDRFATLQSQPVHVHAEMQLLFHTDFPEDFLPYVGSSKHCCFLY